jgi:mannosylglucosylglycerate synthase
MIGEKKEVSGLRYGMLHCRFGDPEGVSIVMKQVEGVLKDYLGVSEENVFYLIGDSKVKSENITESKILWDYTPINRLMQENYERGYSEKELVKIEEEINLAKEEIRKWVEETKIDVLIAHNSAHPVNFVSSVALSRYYKESIEKGKKTPKYVLWWHDSHLEREFFLHPEKKVKEYLIEGVCGPYVEYILFINSIQFKTAKKYFRAIDEKFPGFYERIEKNHNFVYNTTDIFIKDFKEIFSERNNLLLQKFLNDFEINEDYSKTLFVLQHTRLVQRKKIDFALKYCYDLLGELRKKTSYDKIYFFISGHSADNTREKLMELNEELKGEFGEGVKLVFAEDTYSKTSLKFEDYPLIFSKLNGISTYFSNVEGFGNNLLEVMASGIVPIVYKYPVFKNDIEKYNFNLIAFDEYKLNKDNLEKTINLILDNDKKEKWINENLEILKNNFSHKTMADKLRRSINSERLHI